jgi:ArsR family transcriptional regulator, arsenate/arsenite/antimonite-responsive transcriptional repressor
MVQHIDKSRFLLYIPKLEYIGGIMKQFTKVMKALSDPNRVKIVKLLQQKVMCVCELQAALGIAQPSVSKHLKILEEAGLVDFRKEGLWVNYYLSEGKSSPYAANLLGNLRHWLNEDPQVSDLIQMVPHLNREEICNR